MLIGHCTYNSCQPPWPEWLETPCLLPCKVYIGAPCMVNQIGQDRRAHFIIYMLHLLSPGHGKRITLWHVLQ